MESDPFLSFRTLVSASIIKAIYVTGAVILTAGGGVLMAFPFLAYSVAPESPHAQPVLAGLYLVAGAAIASVGNLLWRLMCEGWILLFSIHEMLASIERKMAANNQNVETIAEQVRALDINAEQRHQEALAVGSAWPKRPQPR